VPDRLIIHKHIETYNHKDEGSIKKYFKKEIVILSRQLSMEE